jgi:hypothetical protein
MVVSLTSAVIFPLIPCVLFKATVCDVLSRIPSNHSAALVCLQELIPKYLHVGHLLLGGVSSLFSRGHAPGSRDEPADVGCLHAMLGLLRLPNITVCRPVLAEGCFNVLYTLVRSESLSCRVLDVAQVCVCVCVGVPVLCACVCLRGRVGGGNADVPG